MGWKSYRPVRVLNGEPDDIGKMFVQFFQSTLLVNDLYFLFLKFANLRKWCSDGAIYLNDISYGH